ncbi:MAG: tetratricopeptide repeat protein, partial [Phycisphaerae bacterium]
MNEETPNIAGASETARTPRHLGWVGPIVLVVGAALVMGMPTVRGGFVGSDDHRLALNHVFVNHPSISHAVKLFTVPHRDLYQPLPLLTYQLEFAVGQAVGLFDEGPEGGAWLLHLTNVLLHAANTGLVWFVVVMLSARVGSTGTSEAEHGSGEVTAPRNPIHAYAIATVAALLFAVHPLQTEVIAWLNGRMMLLSTLFALASMLTLASWLDRPRSLTGFLTVLLAILCAISKIRIGLPVLLLIVLVARRNRPTLRFALLWLVCCAVTAFFVFVNIRTTAGAELFAEGAEHLRGPRVVRVLLALGWYFSHVVWPVGLASYYPTPPLVSWSDTGTWQAVAVVLASLVILGLTCLRWRVGWLGVVWFFATVASTLPVMPARNILAADRYMYLPIIGLFWIGGVVAHTVYERMLVRWPVSLRRVVLVVLVLSICVPSIAMGWHIASFYETPLNKTTRIATLFPDTPRVWEPLGWTLYSNGRYEEAIEAAHKELRHDVRNLRSGAHQLIGLSELRRGNPEAALDHLNEAIKIDPDSGLGHYRLGMAYEELGLLGEAVVQLEEAVAIAPHHNPTLNRLASVYRRLGRPENARLVYEQAVANNAYEVPAIMGLAELDIQTGESESFAAAEGRLLNLLDWMPENSAAWTNLGVVYSAMGKTAAAVRAYQTAIETDPQNVNALVNLAQLNDARGDAARAGVYFDRAAAIGLVTIEQALTVHDFFVSQRRPEDAKRMWEVMQLQRPGSPEVRALLIWAAAM